MSDDLECPDGCGACCDPVVLPYGPADLRNLRAIDFARAALAAGGDDDELVNLLFVRDHMTPMTRKEGLRRANYLTGATMALIAGEPTFAWTYFWTCDRFDPETRRCSAYEDRPPMCRDYPLYDSDPAHPDAWLASKALPKTCVYRSLIGQEVTPVTLGPTRRTTP